MKNLLSKLLNLIFKDGSVSYINGKILLPPPLSNEEEILQVSLFREGSIEARNILIEHNLRLVVYVAKRFEKLGYKIYATRSTAKYLQEHGVNALRVNKISQESPNVMDLILGHKIDLVIDTPTQGNGDKSRDGFLIRRNAIETGVYCITAMDTANALAHSLETASEKKTPVDIAKVKNI